MVRRIARPAVASSSDPMATPTTRLTIAVAAFCSSGAPELNGYTTAMSVTSPMIQRKNRPGFGVLSTSRYSRPAATSATSAATSTYSPV